MVCPCRQHYRAPSLGGGPTVLWYGGELQVLPPLNVSMLEGHVDMPNRTVHNDARDGVQSSAWRRVVAAASQGEELRITVLGSSISAGCLDVGGAINLRAGMSRCHFSHAWVRFLQDKLSGLRLRKASARLSVWAKPAVPPSYFDSCTRRYLDANAHVVLLEFQAVLQQRPCSDVHNQLRPLVNSVRRIAPSAAIVFVGWPARTYNERAPYLCSPEDTGRSLLEFGNAQDINILSLAAVVPAERADRRPYYGSVGVHPSELGAHLMAVEVERALTRWVLQACCDHGDAAVPTEPQHVAPTIPSAPFEWCATQGDMLPVIPPAHNWSTWRLVDEGEAGVAKLGWQSLIPGVRDDKLTLNVQPAIKSICAVFAARLGYVQSWKSEYGALLVSCTGDCTCHPKDFGRADAQALNPFPLVEAWHPEYSATITAATTFLINPHPESKSCQVHVTHQRSRVRRSASNPTNDSRVRVDSLGLKIAIEYQQCHFACIALQRGYSAASMADYSRRCAIRAASGNLNATGPECFQDAHTVSDAMKICHRLENQTRTKNLGSLLVPGGAY